ncbi:MAG TPA: HIT domain-containing protein [Chitinophagaceae bacterium]|nr:HIT domain-containing protein [Chitinophagaceae bacterium]
MKQIITLILVSFCATAVYCQSEMFKKKKAEQLAGRSPFQGEIDGKYPERILYQDDDVMVVKSIAAQLPVHILIYPKKRIPTINDLTEADAGILAKMILAAKRMAKELGVAETGYRLAINTNEDAGQSAFHIHMHLLGGANTGPMVDQVWRVKNGKPGSSYLREIDSVKAAYAAYYKAWLQNDSAAVMKTVDTTAVILPSPQQPIKGIDAIRKFWFPNDGSKFNVTKFDYTIDDFKFDTHSAYIMGHSSMSFISEKDGVKTVKENQQQYHTTYLQRQTDGRWLITSRVWSPVK